MCCSSWASCLGQAYRLPPLSSGVLLFCLYLSSPLCFFRTYWVTGIIKLSIFPRAFGPFAPLRPAHETDAQGRKPSVGYMGAQALLPVIEHA